jgi:hypothetical protein
MRILNILAAALLATLSCAGFSSKASAAGGAEAVAVRYHFTGATLLADNTNFARARSIFSLPPAKYFLDLVLDRLAGVYWRALQFDLNGDPEALLHPVLNDLLQTESMATFGGNDRDRIGFVLAARLPQKSAEAWQKCLETALRAPGEPLSAEGFPGRRWRPGSNSVWIVRARDWTVVGRGEDLLPVRTDYLRNIKQDDRPAPVMQETWLSTEVDWPLLATWVPLSNSPLQLARTIVDVTASGGRMRATAYVSYPQEMPWQPEPWRIPKGLVSSPLSSFTASRGLAAYLSPSPTLAHLSSQPFTNQLFCWALRELALQSYAAWPVANASNTLRTLGATAPSVFNPILTRRNHSQLLWMPKDNHLAWTHLQLTAPTLETAHDNNTDFLLAKVFALDSKFVPAPDPLFSQFEQRSDVVYFDWELTGLRLRQWRLLTEILPVFPQPTPQDVARQQKAAREAKPSPLGNQPLTPLAVTEAWLAELGTPILDNTVTEVTRTSPTELTVVRNSEFLFTGLELVLLSHWLADAPIGPIDYTLLPRAKISGPGLPAVRK